MIAVAARLPSLAPSAKKESMKNNYASRLLFAVLFCLAFCRSASAADLKQTTTDAFNKYVAATEARMATEIKTGSDFLYPDRPAKKPSEEMRDAYARLQRGEI